MDLRALHVTVLTRMVSFPWLLMCLSFATLMPQAGSSECAVAVQGIVPAPSLSTAGPFNSTAWFPSGRSECRGIGQGLLYSSNGDYTLELVLKYTNESTSFCWAGVLDTVFQAIVKEFSIILRGMLIGMYSFDLQRTNSCVFSLTEDGGLQLGLGPETEEASLDEEPRIVSWSSNTSGLGVHLFLQDNGILLLRDGNSSVIWQSLEGPILPFSSSQINSVKSGYRYLAGILLSLVLFSCPFP